MTKLTPTPEGQKPLYVVEVPKDATEIGFGNHCLGYKTKLEPADDTNGFTHAKEPNGLFCGRKYKITGTFTLEGNTAVTDFDTAQIMGKEHGMLNSKYTFQHLLAANGCTNTEVKYVLLQQV